MASAAILNFGKMSITPDWIKISAPNFTGIVEASNFKFGTQLGFGMLTKKQRFGPKLAGVWARGASKKNWDPLSIFATVEASNFKFGTQLGFETSLPKNNVLDQNSRGSGPGSIQKKLGPPKYFCNR